MESIRTRATRLFLSIGIVTLLSSWTEPVRADGWNYSVDVLARSYALGLGVNPTVAYRKLLWGDETSPFHGYVRPTVTATLAPAFVAGRVGLEIYPVSFFGVTVGRAQINRFSEFPGQDCNLGDCIGELSTTDIGAHALFQFGPVAGMFRFTRTFYEGVSDRSQDIIEPVTSTLLSSGGEVVSSSVLVVGTPISELWFTGVMGQYAELRENSGTQNGQYFIVRTKRDAFTYMAGVGRFESELKRASVSLLFTMSWAI